MRVKMITDYNVIKISKYDSLGRKIGGSFELKFKAYKKSKTYLVYPNLVQMRSVFKVVLKK